MLPSIPDFSLVLIFRPFFGLPLQVFPYSTSIQTFLWSTTTSISLFHLYTDLSLVYHYKYFIIPPLYRPFFSLPLQVFPYSTSIQTFLWSTTTSISLFHLYTDLSLVYHYKYFLIPPLYRPFFSLPLQVFPYSTSIQTCHASTNADNSQVCSCLVSLQQDTHLPMCGYYFACWKHEPTKYRISMQYGFLGRMAKQTRACAKQTQCVGIHPIKKSTAKPTEQNPTWIKWELRTNQTAKKCMGKLNKIARRHCGGIKLKLLDYSWSIDLPKNRRLIRRTFKWVTH